MEERYFAITTLSQDITKVNGNGVTQTDIQGWVNGHPGWRLYTYNNDPVNYYTSLIAPVTVETAKFTTDGDLTGNLIGGSHPAFPPPRPK